MSWFEYVTYVDKRYPPLVENFYEYFLQMDTWRVEKWSPYKAKLLIAMLPDNRSRVQ